MRIRDFARLKGPYRELRDQLRGEYGEERLAELKLWLKKATGLLQPLHSVAMAGTEEFVVEDFLGAEGTNHDDIKINFIGEAFRDQIVPLIERRTRSTSVLAHCLERYATTGAIAAALPERMRVTTPSQLYRLLRAFKSGRGWGFCLKPMLVTGASNLFLMYGKDGNLWIVSARRMSGGWNFHAHPLRAAEQMWECGSRVFSEAA